MCNARCTHTELRLPGSRPPLKALKRLSRPQKKGLRGWGTPASERSGGYAARSTPTRSRSHSPVPARGAKEPVSPSPRNAGKETYFEQSFEPVREVAQAAKDEESDESPMSLVNWSPTQARRGESASVLKTFDSSCTSVPKLLLPPTEYRERMRAEMGSEDEASTASRVRSGRPPRARRLSSSSSQPRPAAAPVAAVALTGDDELVSRSLPPITGQEPADALREAVAERNVLVAELQQALRARMSKVEDWRHALEETEKRASRPGRRVFSV